MADASGLVEPFRSNVLALIKAADKRGVQVVIVSGRRTYEQQAALRKANGCPDVHTSPASSCRVPTARPGTSKHESGQAVDLGPATAYKLIAELAPAHNLAATVKGEPWHYEPSGGATAPAAGVVVPAGEDGGGSTGGLGAIAGVFSALVSWDFWRRVLYILGGLALIAGGLAMLGVDLTIGGAA